MEILHHSPKGEWYIVSKQQPAWKPKFPLLPLPQFLPLTKALYAVQHPYGQLGSAAPAASPPYFLPQAYLSGQGQSEKKRKPWHSLVERKKPQEFSCCEKSPIHLRQTQFTVTIKVTSNWRTFYIRIKVITTSVNLNISGTAIISAK